MLEAKIKRPQIGYNARHAAPDLRFRCSQEFFGRSRTGEVFRAFPAFPLAKSALELTLLLKTRIIMPKQACTKFPEPAVKSIKDGLSVCTVAPAMIGAKIVTSRAADVVFRHQGIYGYC